MNSGSLRILALAACAALAAGCDDHSGPAHGSGASSHSAEDGTFFDDFSGHFPSPNWEIRDGSPFTHDDVGDKAPGLVMRPFGDRIRLRGTFQFSTSEPLTLSFDLGAYELQWSSHFKARILPVSSGSEALFETHSHKDEIRLRIGGSDDEDDFDFKPDGGYHEVMFVIDSSGAASWWVNGKQFMKRSTFTQGTYRIQLETTGGDETKFVVDNVRITRP